MEYWENAYDNQTSYFASPGLNGELQPITESTCISRTPRLPPRSRSGCWTCRNRKVKFVTQLCDERRPKCRQCIRLDHECDYSPKLVFKDETLKVVDKYVEPLSTGRSWTSESEQQLLPVENDSLPPFTHLTNDEDWQQKATYQRPGTYYVVANSDSFADSPDYKISSAMDSRSGPSTFPTQKTKSNVSLDHATVLLGRFEGGSRKLLGDSSSITDESRYSLPLRVSHASYNLLGSPIASPRMSETSVHLNEHSESTLIRHWRAFVRKQLFSMCIPTNISSTDLVDLVENASTSYLPLRHALLALCALSLTMKQEGQTVQALEHYMKTIDALKESHTKQDLASDGLFLTHYILLIYEISATDRYWYHHMESLKSIIARRRAVIPREPFASIVFSICVIDATALISCSGNGTVVLDHAFRKYIPTSQDFRNAASILPTDLMTSSDWDLLGPAYDFLHDLVILWTILGQTSCQIRQEIQEQGQVQAQMHSNIIGLSTAMVARWQTQVLQIRGAIKQQWQAQGPSTFPPASNEQQSMFEQVRRTYEQAMLLYHSSIIYSYTSMWPTQVGDSDLSENDCMEIEQSIGDVLRITIEIVARGDLQQRTAVLALLLVGHASRNENERYTALALLKRLEEAALGCNTKATRTLYEAMLKRQDQLKDNGLPEHVDWILMAQELGWKHLVNFGL